MRVPASRLGRLVLATLALGLVSCSEDIPEVCTRASEGEFLIRLDPESFADPFRFTAVLEELNVFESPPSARYRFRLANQQTLALFVPDLGYLLPMEVGQTYTVEAVVKGGVPGATGIRIFDGSGLLHVAVADFTPNQRVFASGYGTTPDGKRLGVRFDNGGCPDIAEDNECLQGLTNRVLVFEIDGVARGVARHGESVTADGWVMHCYKAISVVPSCPSELQNQLSFFIEREDAR